MLKLEKELKLKEYADVTYFTEEMNKGNRVVAQAIYYNSKEKIVICKLSNFVNAILPLQESFIEEPKPRLRRKAGKIYYPELSSIIGSNIGVYITSYIPELSAFEISRRESMVEAFEEIQEGKSIYCSVKSMTDKTLFVDCGYGLIGAIYISDSSLNRIRKVSDSFKVGDIIKCKITNVDRLNHQIALSRRLAVEEENITFEVGDIVYGRVREQFADPNDIEGQKSYFFEILPYNLSAVLNTFSDTPTLNYNEELVCYVSRVKEDGKCKLKIANPLL